MVYNLRGTWRTHCPACCQGIAAVERPEDADATLWDKARELRRRCADVESAQPPLSLADAERQVVAYPVDVEEGRKR